MILYIWEVSSEGPCIGAHHCQKGHTTGGRRLPIIMASMATTVFQQRHQSRQIFAPTISPILLVIDWSAYIGYIRSVCVAVAIGRPLVGAAASWLMSKNGSICRVNGRVMRSTSPYVGIRHLEPVGALSPPCPPLKKADRGWGKGQYVWSWKDPYHTAPGRSHRESRRQYV